MSLAISNKQVFVVKALLKAGANCPTEMNWQLEELFKETPERIGLVKSQVNYQAALMQAINILFDSLGK